MTPRRMTTALSGIRVLDLSDRSAALAGRVLADLGAEVIMVEPPGGNSIRHLQPRLEGVVEVEASFAHQYFSANKRSVVVDLATQQELFLSLVGTADVVIDTERPGCLDSLGLSHEVLRSANPLLIQCSVTPFGMFGEWRDRKASDLVAGAAGGLIWLSGEPRGKPVQGGADVTYAMAGLIAASAISIALHQRKQRQRRQWQLKAAALTSTFRCKKLRQQQRCRPPHPVTGRGSTKSLGGQDCPLRCVVPTAGMSVT